MTTETLKAFALNSKHLNQSQREKILIKVEKADNNKLEKNDVLRLFISS